MVTKHFTEFLMLIHLTFNNTMRKIFVTHFMDEVISCGASTWKFFLAAFNCFEYWVTFFVCVSWQIKHLFLREKCYLPPTTPI